MAALLLIYLGNFFLTDNGTTITELTKNINQVATEKDTRAWSRSEVGFAYDLAKTAEQFPRISYLNAPIRVIKANFKKIKMVCKTNPEFWGNI